MLSKAYAKRARLRPDVKKVTEIANLISEVAEYQQFAQSIDTIKRIGGKKAPSTRGPLHPHRTHPVRRHY